ncbi:MAG: ROK family protein [Rhodocyclaceae bacterium]
MESKEIRLGIDLGGTKIEIVALDNRGTELLRRRVATPRNDYPATVHAVAALVGAAERELGVRCTVGVGTPGAMSAASGNLKNSNSTWLNDQPLRQDLERALGREIRLANDANCFALSEAVDGAGEGRDVVFGVILGTGVGGGIVVRHHVLTGANAIAGEWGHNPLPFPRPEDLPAPPCYCGQHGCVETFLSGPGMARDHFLHGGQTLDAPAVVAAALSGDAACAATLARYEERLARALAQVINLLDPDIIVLGGGMSNIERLYENVPRLWTPFVFSDHVATPLVRNLHGDSSGVRGAAWLWS